MTTPAEEGTTQLLLYDDVRLRREVEGFPAETEGAIVEVFAEQNAYLVELFKRAGETIGLIDATGEDLEPAPEPLA